MAGAERSRDVLSRRQRSTAVLAVLLVLAAGCSTPSGAESEGGLGRTSPATAPSSAVPTDAAGDPLVRPSCAEPGEGTFLHAKGAGARLTSVLLLGRGSRGVVVGAQANGGICQVLPFARELVGKGYHVAVFDWIRSQYGDDMTSATRALIADGAVKVVLGGFSRGALVGLGIAPSLGSPVVGVFSVSGGPSAAEGFGSVAALSGFPGPILLVGSVGDPVFPPAATTDAIAAAHAGPETVLTVPGNEHALALLRGPEGPRVQAAIDAFLVQVLPSG
jgi:hypothetical protein